MLTHDGLTIPMDMAGTTAPVKVWLPEWEIEAAASAQLRNIAELPWVHGVRVMPDVHYGKGATVGSVIAMRGAVSPAAVGVDIGCGVAAVRTSLTLSDLDGLERLRSAIESAVPVGFNEHTEPLQGGAVRLGGAAMTLRAPRSVRRNVINAVEGMTGLQVTEVTIAVNDIHLPSEDDGAADDVVVAQPSRVE